MQLNLDTLDVRSFETAASVSDTDRAAPVTEEPWYDSLCYICFETGRTMCYDSCDAACPPVACRRSPPRCSPAAA